jgi:hypothetical protein
VSLESTAGSTTADSFCSVVEANAYHAARLHNEVWYNATTDSRERALKWATRLLDSMMWKGQKADSDQALTWPRSYVYDANGDALLATSIPNFLISATSEYAFELLKSDREVDSDTSGIKEVMAGEVLVKFDKTDRPSKTPTSVYRIISNYLGSGSSPNFTRIERI